MPQACTSSAPKRVRKMMRRHDEGWHDCEQKAPPLNICEIWACLNSGACCSAELRTLLGRSAHAFPI